MEADSSSGPESLVEKGTESATSEEISSTVEEGPRPVQIVKVNDETREFELDLDALSSILLKDSIRDMVI